MSKKVPDSIRFSSFFLIVDNARTQMESNHLISDLINKSTLS